MPDETPGGSRPVAWRRWEAVQPILDAALEVPPAERARFLTAACGGDAELRAAVEELLAHADREGGLLERDPAGAWPHLVSEVIRTDPARRDAALETLRTALADRYAIERQVGAGGMAVVYLARDLRHDRRVALKVLRPELSAVIGATRFLSEIKTTANLQHPHILPLHDSGEVNGAVFYVMPYVEGESLRARLQREKQLPIDSALGIARGVASALDYAHRRGIVHRDIKPENILLQDGQALVADFGIALAATAGGARMTETGMSLGTPTYMSPEQAMGERTLDGRADIYALACVLYEMLTGEPPYVGPTPQAIVAKVMTAQPVPPRALRGTIPEHVEAAILVGLQKLPADRFATAAEFTSALDGSTASRSMRAVAAPVMPGAARSWRLATIPVVVLAALAAWGWLRPRPMPPLPLTRFSLPVEVSPGVPELAVSPNGAALVYVGNDARQTWPLILRRLDREERSPIPGTDRASQPFFSPDGQSIGFLQDGKLRKVSLAGGDVATIVDVSAMEGSTALNQVMYGATWGPAGEIVLATPRGLYAVSSNGGTPRLVAAPDSSSGDWYFLQPTFTDDGGNVLVDVLSRDYRPRIALVSMADGKVASLGITGREPKYVHPGHLVYTDANGRLLSARIDLRQRRITGEPQLILEHVALMESPVRAFFDVSRSGTIAYVGRGGPTGRELVLVDRRGSARALTTEHMAWRHPRFSPDGRRLAVGVDAMGAGGDIWTLDLEAHRLSRVTFDSLSIHPVWSRDGAYVVFPHPRLQNNRSAILRVRADGSTKPESLLSWPRQVWESEPMPDGSALVFRDDNPRTIRDIRVARIDSPSVTRVLLGSALNERSIAVAPFGAWLAYVSNANGRDEVYIGRIADDSPRWPVSLAGGSEPRWSRDGRELYFRNGDTLLAAAVRLGVTPTVSQPHALFTGQFQSSPHHALYDPSPNGREFAMVRPIAPDDGMTVHVVLHWFDRQGEGAQPQRGAGRAP